MAQGGKKRARVLVLGAGFGGLAAVKRLCGRAEVEVTVIDKAVSHTYYPLLYEVATGFTHGRDMIGEAALARGVSFSYEKMLKRWGCGFVCAPVIAVDAARRTVTTAEWEEYPYDYLVVAFGFATDYFDIPRLAERSLQLASLDDALAIRDRILDYLDRKKRGKEVSLRIMIGGGGPTGVETAAELANFFRARQQAGEIHSGDWIIRLVEASPRLLSMLPPAVSGRVLKRLEHLGVKVMLDTCFKRVEGTRVILAPRPLRPGESPEALACEFRPEAERAFEAEVVIWCGGVRGSAAAAFVGLPLDRKGRIVVDPTLAAAGADRIFAIGDCAALTNPEDGKPVPALAQSAIEMGALAAENILRRTRGARATSFRFHPYPTIIPLGGKTALAHFGTWHVWGFPGWLLRQAVTFRYWLSVLSPVKALFIFVRSTLSYMSND